MKRCPSAPSSQRRAGERAKRILCLVDSCLVPSGLTFVGFLSSCLTSER